MKIVIRNWDKFNPRSDYKVMSWFRLENGFTTSMGLFKYSVKQKYLWIAILCEISKRSGEAIDFEVDFFAEITTLSKSEVASTVSSFARDGMLELIDAAQGDCVTPSQSCFAVGYTSEKKSDENEQFPIDRIRSDSSDNLSYGTVRNGTELIINTPSVRRCVEVLDYWNNKKIIVHSSNEKLLSAISRKMKSKKLSTEQVFKAIDNYDAVLKSKETFWTHAYTLKDFLSRETAEKFFAQDFSFDSFRSNKNSQFLALNGRSERFSSDLYINPYANEVKP